MAPFYPVYIRRSDGKLETQVKGQPKELNQPPAEQLDPKPHPKTGISDFYRQCAPGDGKELEWRRKLAGMLMRELGKNELKYRNYILAALPDGYRVFEHVKCKLSSTDGAPLKPDKSHAAGSNERQDAYLYGNPGGRKKRYRSPAEFFPHLLWLATDASGDPDNCSCKFCSPEELEADEKPPLKAITATTRESNMQTDIKNRDAALKTSGKAPYSSQTPQARQSQPQPLRPSPLPSFRSLEQKLDAKYDEFRYRPGEVVWFSRGAAWGLGVVVKRSLSQGYGSQHLYNIQPLSHPFGYPDEQICMQNLLRPWLAWSPPPCTCSGLNPGPGNNNRVLTYDQIDWKVVQMGGFGQGDAEVDASIMAVKAVERTFTPFDPIDAKPTTEGLTETRYNGIYLGGEKLWVGEPLRLRNTTVATDMMVLHEIVERSSTFDPKRPRMIFVGDTYTYRITQLEPEAVPQDDSHLPMRVREDLRYRNSITMQHPDPSRNFTSFWRLQVKGARLDVSAIKGRWYESSLFLPILDEAGYPQSRSQGEISDAGLWMNGHGDCNRTPASSGDTGRPGRPVDRPAELKVRRREEAFGRSVPVGFRISRGLDEVKREHVDERGDVKMEDRQYPRSQVQDTTRKPTPKAEQSPPTERPAQSFGSISAGESSYVLVPPVSDSTFDQYMKFEDNEGDGELPGFGRQYDTQGLDQQFLNNDAMQQ